LTESPVLSMPIALSENSLPIGIQVVGKRYEDFKLLEIAKILDDFSEKFHFPLQK
jgi:amidase